MTWADGEIRRLSQTPFPDVGADSPWPEGEPEEERPRRAWATPTIEPPDTLEVGLAGVSFVPGYPQVVHDLGRTVGYDGAPEDVRLFREPGNPHDSNAVQVVWMRAGVLYVLGHLPAELAAVLAPRIDAGESWVVESVRVLVEPMFPERPGVEIRISRSPSHPG